MEARWNFPITNGGATSGISDSGIETFIGTRIKSLAREICQNSIDAAADETTPVKIQFSSFKIPSSSIPDVNNLKYALSQAKEYPDNNSTKAQSFFNNAINIINQEEITCLRISDFNTTGLLDADKSYNSAWVNLTKSKGSSFKSGSTGGSFGIGKSAAYACSYIRTVFYGTHDCNGLDAFQGVSILPSFIDEDKNTTQGTGFCGNCGSNTPVFEQISIDPGFSRTENGTDIYIIGYMNEDDWKEKIVASVLDGFLYAFFSGKLIVYVDDIEVSKDTLSFVIDKYKDSCEEHAYDYYRALTCESEDGKVFETNILKMGKVTLYLMLHPDMHRRVAMVRKTGMKIFDKGSISGLIKFGGLLYIEGDEINSFLRDFENPQHTKWELGRTDDPKETEKVKKAEKVIKELRKFIVDCLNELKDESSTEEVDPAVGEYLAAEREENAPEDRTENLNDEIKEFKKREIKVNKPKEDNFNISGESDREVDDEDGDITEDDIPGTGGRQGDGTPQHGESGGGSGFGDGGGPHFDEHKKSRMGVAPSKLRIMSSGNSKEEYIITFTPSVSAENCSLDLFLSAESDRYDANLITAEDMNSKKQLSIKDNHIAGLSFVEGAALKIKVKIKYSDYCSMEVRAYGHKI